MKISTEFSKNAQSYDELNKVQKQVVEQLLSYVDTKPQVILDLGCGSGALVKSISWDYKHFIGVDFASGMLELHPKSEKIECVYGDFNDPMLFEHLRTYTFDYIFSASALQWAEDLEIIFQQIASLNAPVSLAIFTANTFKTLNETAGIQPLLRNALEVERLQKKYLPAHFDKKEYKLYFSSVRDMFRYIKRSGVSGSRKVLSYKQTKMLMEDYPVDYLEFEVVFIHTHGE